MKRLACVAAVVTLLLTACGGGDEPLDPPVNERPCVLDDGRNVPEACR
jgi:hypothetical protein